MSTLTLSTTTANTAIASLLRFARALFQAAPGGNSELATLYRLSRGSDSVRPAVNERLARRAKAQ